MTSPVGDGRIPEIAGIIERELERQNTTIQLIASENFTSRAVLEAQGSVLTNKYSEGYPAKRYYGGNFVVDEAENLARERACELFGAEHANVQPHSGANANQAAFMALLEPGDKVMGMRLDQGGHLTHGSPVNFSGRMYDFVAYGVDDDHRGSRLRRDPRSRGTRATANDHRGCDGVPAHHRLRGVPRHRRRDRRAAPRRRRAHRGPDRGRRAPVAGAARRCRHAHDPQDAARPARRRDPVPARARRGAIDKAVFPGLQGGPLMHVIAAKAVAFLEASQPSFRRYAADIVTNARALADALDGRGIPDRLGRHRQSPDAGRPPLVRRHREGRARRHSTGPASPATRTRSRTIRRSRS